jgi:carbon-monoxide dehydrogenase medium subunit
MKLPPFEYHAPDSLDEVLAILAEHGGEAKIIAGGQSLVPLLAMRLARPGHVVDVNRVPELSGIDDHDGQMVFGTTARQRTAERSSLVGQRLPLLTDALHLVGHPAIRTRGTIGGSVAHADAAAEIPCVIAALDGSVVVRSARGARTIEAADWFRGHFTTAIEDDECAVEVRVPIPDPSSGYAFCEVARRHGDFALVGVAAVLTIDSAGLISDARIALMGVADVPYRARSAEDALVGVEPTIDAFTAAAQTAAGGLRPASDVHGSAAYRSHLASVTVRRALTIAAARALEMSERVGSQGASA